MKRNWLIVIVGPTAVGKTSLAIQLARTLQTEIISADARQVFKELAIGTAKPTSGEMASVPHHFIDHKSITEEYDAGHFGREALQVIQHLFQKYPHVILCGGSGLYVRAVTEGFDDMPEISADLRESIIEEYKKQGLEWLQKRVAEEDPDYFAVVDQKNPQRLMRALELSRAAGKPSMELRKKNRIEHPFHILKIGLELERDELYKRIDDRMDAMIENGLFEEAERFYPQRALQALQTVGYREIFDFMDGVTSKEEAVRLLKRNSRRYAKRQLTWFKKDKEINWFRPNQVNEILNLVFDKVNSNSINI